MLVCQFPAWTLKLITKTHTSLKKLIMALFKINEDQSIDQIKEKPFKLEKEIQKIVETNLFKAFNLMLVKSEFALNNFRIDSLAYDQQSKSFVIVEYKNDKSFSVVDQGYAYLSLMLNNKADFILEYNENSKDNLKKSDVDWSQSRVIFIAPYFTPYQRESINFKDLPIELWEVKRYDNNTLSLEKIKTTGSTESIKTISKQNSNIENVSKEIKAYKEEDHVKYGSEEIRELYFRFKEAITNLGEMEIKPLQDYIGFKANTNFVDIEIYKKSLKLHINLKKGELDDPKGIARDMIKKGHAGNGDYEIKVQDDENLEYIIDLISQSYHKHS